MPVRALSRASRSSKKASQLVCMPRSSSRSASQPWLMTPPSRTSAAGSSSRYRLSRAAQAGGACRSSKIFCSSSDMPCSAVSDGSASDAGRSCSALCKVSRSAMSSRGRTWRRAMRAVIRSTSLQPLRRARSVCCKPARRVLMAVSRAAAWLRSRRGDSSQFLSKRLPMPVVQVSSSEKRVGESSPRRVCVSSRLRRVVDGSSISSPERTTCSVCTWLRARPWVCSA